MSWCAFCCGMMQCCRQCGGDAGSFCVTHGEAQRLAVRRLEVWLRGALAAVHGGQARLQGHRDLRVGGHAGVMHALRTIWLIRCVACLWCSFGGQCVGPFCHTHTQPHKHFDSSQRCCADCWLVSPRASAGRRHLEGRPRRLPHVLRADAALEHVRVLPHQRDILLHSCTHG